MSDFLRVILELAGGTVSLGLIVFGIYGVFRGQAIQTNVAVLSAANTELHTKVTDLTAAMLKEQADCRDLLHAERLACQTQIADMQGQLKALTGDFVKQLVAAVAQAAKPDPAVVAVAAAAVLDTAATTAASLAHPTTP